MSYCRVSSGNWRCDVYVFESGHGWTTHVARQRRLFPPVPDLVGGTLALALHGWSGCFWEAGNHQLVYPYRWRGVIYRAWCAFLAFWHTTVHLGSLRVIPLRPIGLPHNGAIFDDPTPGDCADRLEHLRALGYRVPQGAIDTLRDEAAEALADKV